MKQYKYKPVRFYVTCFAVTWAFWILAAIISRSEKENGISTLLMLSGLITPAVTAVVTVLTSGSKALKADLKRKLIGFYRIKPLSILAAVVLFMAIVVLSILLSLLAGQSFNQFAFTEDFSFSVGGTSALLTILLACIIFHLFVNTMQEKIAMTPQTKCVETIVVFLAAAFIVLTNKEMFFEKEHIGNLLAYKEERKEE